MYYHEYAIQKIYKINLTGCEKKFSQLDRLNRDFINK